MRVLVVDDDTRLARSLARGLRAEGYAADVAHTGDEARWLLGECAYDVIVLDVMLPGVSGHQLCRELRAAGNGAPVLMLTARQGEHEEVRALDLGADDFLAKPFSYAVLLARLRALLRRGESPRSPALDVGDLHLDPAAHTVRRGDRSIELTARQFALLEYLMRRAGDVVPKAELIEHVWDFAFEGSPNIVEVYVSQLRRRVDLPFGRESIQTVRGVGYRIAEG